MITRHDKCLVSGNLLAIFELYLGVKCNLHTVQTVEAVSVLTNYIGDGDGDWLRVEY